MLFDGKILMVVSGCLCVMLVCNSEWWCLKNVVFDRGRWCLKVNIGVWYVLVFDEEC